MMGDEVGKVFWIPTAGGFAYPEQGAGIVLWSHYQVSIRGWAVDDMITESCFRKGLAGSERMNWRETSCNHINKDALLTPRLGPRRAWIAQVLEARESVQGHKHWGLPTFQAPNYKDGFCLCTLVFPMMLCTWGACDRKFVEWMNAHLLGTTSESKTKCAQKLDIDNIPEMPWVTAYYTHWVKSSLCNKPSCCAP